MLRRSRVVLTVLSLLAGLLVATVPTATPAAAANNQPKPLSRTAVVTNNIQGSTGGTDSKWGITVRGLIQNNDIVLLQEVGPGGPPAPDGQPTNEQTPIVRNGATIRHFIWQVGAMQGPGPRGSGVALAQVYYLQTDNFGGTGTGGRVNIAIVTRDVPDDFMVVTNPNQRGRAALGVRFGTTWYFTIHGLAYGGPVNDSQDLLDAIDTDVNTAGAAAGVAYSYTVGGDFNVEPNQLAGANGLGIPPGSRIINSNRATQQNGRELDYFVSDDPTSPPTLANGRAAIRQNGAQADHYAVRMGALRAASLPPSLDVMF
ncbi:MAG TPA: endonuclease/exonuclease/phosphatase family protein, partial [Pseudonocardiaceae bacterium]